MATYHYAVTVTTKRDDDLDPAELMLESLRNRVEHVEIEPLGEDEETD